MNMDSTSGTGLVPAPTHRANDFFAYEKECKAALAPVLADLIDIAEAAGWNRRTVASTLMFLAAQHVSPPPASVEATPVEAEQENAATGHIGDAEDFGIEIAVSDLTDDSAQSDGSHRND